MSLQYITAHPRVTLHHVCLGRSSVCLISRFFSIFSLYPSFCLSLRVNGSVSLGLSMCAFRFVSGLFTCVSLGPSMRASMSVRVFECLWCLLLI